MKYYVQTTGWFTGLVFVFDTAYDTLPEARKALARIKSAGTQNALAIVTR